MDLKELVDEVKQKMDQIRDIVEGYKEELDSLLKMVGYNIDREKFLEFMSEPYCIIPRDESSYWIIVPKFVDFYAGWLEHETKSYNIFVLNRYLAWLSEIPPDIMSKLKFEEKPPLKVADGFLITGREWQNMAWRRYREFLSRREGEDKIRIKRGHEFELIANLVKDGILPFIPRKVDKSDIREFTGIKLRDYQEEIWKRFLECGAIGVYLPFGSGKSFLGLYALARIKGRKLVVVPNNTLKEQWNERINEFIKEYSDEVEVITYHSHHKVRGKKYTLVVFDECHHLPAPTFIKLSTINTKYRIGLSGSPFREDGNEHFVFALTGFPVGLNWKDLIGRGVVAKPRFKLYVVENKNEKVKRLSMLLRIPVRTIVFCDSIEFGKMLSKKLGIPFVYGGTRRRLDIIRSHDQVIVSRVGDEGISLPDVERTIEVDFLFGSRMQESQRYGRLMHSKKEPQHIIIMTRREYEKYYKRLMAITGRGFRLEVVT